MNRQQAAKYFLSSPTKLMQYVCYNNPDGTADLLADHFPHVVPAEGFQNEDQLAGACLQAANESGDIAAFAQQLASSVIALRKPTQNPNKWADIKMY